MPDPRPDRRLLLGAGAALVPALAVRALLGRGAARAAEAAAQASDPAPQASDAVWASSFKDLTDTMQPLSQWRGRTAVIYFFATWCIPCHLETPKLVKLYDTFRDRGVVVIGIALDNADKTRAFAKKYAVAYPVVYGGREAVQLGRDLGNDQGAIPFTVVMDKAGRIVEVIQGDTPDGKLEAVLAPLVG